MIGRSLGASRDRHARPLSRRPRPGPPLLGQAVTLREALDDDAAAAASRRNLRLLLASFSDESSEPLAGPLAAVRDVDVSAPREAARPATRTSRAAGAGVLSLTALLFAMVGWFGYWAIASGLSKNQTAQAVQPPLAQAVSQPRPEDPPAARLYLASMPRRRPIRR